MSGRPAQAKEGGERAAGVGGGGVVRRAAEERGGGGGEGGEEEGEEEKQEALLYMRLLYHQPTHLPTYIPGGRGLMVQTIMLAGLQTALQLTNSY